MTALRRTSALWITALLTAGGLLALALLAQTILNYRYVSSSLIRQEARRTAEERVRNVERSARLAHAQDAESFGAILEDLRGETSDQLASIVLIQGDGAVTAGSGQPMLAPQERARLVADRSALLERESEDGREILIGVFPCRCGIPRPGAGSAGPPGRSFLEIAIYRDSLSAPFARLRRDAAISASAALALLLSVTLIALRFGPYVRGKQLEVQMDVARQVQRDLLPAPDSWPAGLDLAAECIPASQVGGDFYDVVSLPAGRVAFALGDVSGHGISAALLMGLIHGAMSSPPWGAEGNDPEHGAARLNELLLTKSSGERYASLFWCAYDPSSGVLRYINAGHLPPLLIRSRPDGTRDLDRLSEGGPVLGLLSSATHHVASVQARHGDLLVLFSDGIVEATNNRNDQFGEDRLIAIAQAHALEHSREVCDAIVSAVRAFSGAKPAEDDQTLLVVRLGRE
jgi:hypothetical protein